MDLDAASPPQRHAPPHIRLNSGSDDLLIASQQQSADAGSSAYAPQPFRQPSSRSLTQAAQSGTSDSHRMSNGLYNTTNGESAAELLLPPKKSRARRFRDDDTAPDSPSHSGVSSRRTSWSSESAGSRDSRYGGPFVSPFDDSRTPSRAGSEEEGVNTQTVSEKYNILPSAGLLLFPEDVEKDDYMHNPDPNDEKDGKFNCSEVFTKRGLVNVGGLALITLGILTLMVVYPVVTFVSAAVTPPPNTCKDNPLCISENVPLLKNVRGGPIDPTTPSSAMTRKDSKGKTQTLVFSDEFNEEGRTFYDGDDPYFQAVDLWYGVTMDLEWYDPDAASTSGGVLNLRFDAFQNHDLNYRSGMLQSWNKLCFKGGFLEASISLPGEGSMMGFWPGFWAMGNLGRPGYASTTDGMWPYSYHDECDVGITPNQSDPDGLNFLPGMRLPACTCPNEDHPTPGKSRTAPEIDVIEASVGYLDPPVGQGLGSASQSFQVAPFDIFWRPNTDWIEVYDQAVSSMNSYQGGVYQQALSTVTYLNNDWYDGKAYQTYGFEYEPGADGYIVWNVGDTSTWRVTGNAVGPNGNVGQRVIPQEPMSIVANFGMSNNFANVNLTGLAPLMPATMRFDYIRIYQGEDGELTCDPKDYPTTEYIAQHRAPYTNPNLTHWAQAGYSFPSNSYMHGCPGSSSSSSSGSSSSSSKKRSEDNTWLGWLS